MADTLEGLEPTRYCYNCGTYLKDQIPKEVIFE